MGANRPKLNADKNPEVVHIRQFSYPQDYAEVYALWESAGSGIRAGRSDTPEEITKKLQRDPDLFLVAYVPNKIVGTVMGGFDGRRGMIYHLAVLEDYRGQGIGAELMDRLEEGLRKKGCRRCYLLVTQENHDAIRFYEDRGWQQMNYLYAYGKDLD
jgi:ribosomal protein S18 acetylase RimI-like enzyme